MKSGDLPFLPIYYPQMASQDVSLAARIRNQCKTIAQTRKGALLISVLVSCVVLAALTLLWPRRTELSLPSLGFQDTADGWKSLTHLILLPGHAIQWCTDVGKSPKDESCWYLQSFQKGQVPLFLEHIRRAIEEAANDPKSLLIFSGGQTRPGVGLRTEAHSYFSAAEAMGFFADFDGTNVYDRSVSEDFAKDSLENLMFSVCRFKEIVGHYPRKITVVGFPFKGPRFVELHRKAINFPLENFKYIGVEVRGYKQSHIVDGAYADFKNDLYGCGDKLKEKRASRNPYHHFHAYKESCPDMTNYLDACADL